MDEYALCVLKDLTESFITHNIKGYIMNLNNLTNRQLENKIKARRTQISKDDTQTLELIESLARHKTNTETVMQAILEIVSQRIDKKHEDLGYIDEITEVLENQIWMQNRNTK